MATPHQVALLAGIRANIQIRGQQATYHTKAGGLLPMTVVMGQIPTATETIAPVQVMAGAADFIVATADLVGHIPERGDHIELDGERFDVTNEFAERHWSPHESTQMYLRIHTKRRGPVA